MNATTLPWERRELSRVTVYLTILTLVMAVTGLIGAGPALAATAPGKPTNVAGAPGDASVALSWTAPADNGAAITEYRIRSSADNGVTWSPVIISKSSTTAFKVTGLRNGAPHVFKVRARNSIGLGPWSAASAPITPTSPVQDPTTQQPTSDPTPKPPSPSGWWAPTKGTTWQWQLSGAIDTSVDAAVFDIDGEQNTAATVAALHAKGAKVICYFDAGGWENYRSDAASFPEVVKGNTVGGWPDERWLDIRRLDILIPIMEKRVQDCVAKGFDAIEPDLMDGYTNKTGFPLTYQDQLNYNRALADLGHKYGLGVALKNDPEQVKDLVNDFDFVIVEECAQYNECGEYKPFSDAGKAVLHTEYQGTLDSFCPTTKAMGFSSMKKKLDLTAWREVCA